MIAPPAATTTKATLRGEALARRDTITSAERQRASALIGAGAVAIAAARRPRVLAAYLPIWSEVDPSAIIAWAFAQGVAVVLPAVIDATTFVYRRYREGDTLEVGAFGTQAPPVDAEIADPDIIVSPMIAFDRTGMRLGHGRGYYDRAIARLRARGVRPALLGVAFVAQEVQSIPAEPHDVRMDWIVTERETLDFRSQAKG